MPVRVWPRAQYNISMSKAPLAEVIRIKTPRQYLLDGLWFGPSRARRVFIFVHGLGSSGFSHHGMLMPLVDRHTSVIFFNNRGHDVISGVRKAAKNKKGYIREPGGAGQERFVDCADDIEGVVRFAEKRGAKEIYLIGHSTGSQKSAYYMARKGRRRHVAGVVLMAPLSDHAIISSIVSKGKLKKAEEGANKLMRQGKLTALIPDTLWPETISAERFISLYSGKGPEEIFTYWDPNRRPVTLRKIRTPILVALAGKDEHADRPAEDMAAWFSRHLKDGDAITIIPGANHGFHRKEIRLIAEIGRWLALPRTSRGE